MLKTGIVIILLIIELVCYYTFGRFFSFLVQIAIVSYLLLWYYSERKPNFTKSDKLLYVSTIVSLSSPLTEYISDPLLNNFIKFILSTVSYILIIVLFISEGAKISFKGKTKTFLIFVSYVFTPLAFLFAVIFPLASTQNAIISGGHILPLIYMVLLSAFLPYPEKSKLYISISMFLILLASGISAYRLYISSFPFDYAMHRTLITLCRLFMLLGMLNRFDLRDKLT